MGEIATRLKTAMEKAGVKPHTLAAALTRQSVRGGSYGSIRNYLSGKSEPPLEFIIAAEKELGVVLRTGEPEPEPRAHMSDWAPDCIPESERERFVWLAVSVKSDVGEDRLPGNDAIAATLRLVAAPLMELRRRRGEPAITAEAALDELRKYSPEKWRDYVLFGRMALERIVHPARSPQKPKASRIKGRK